MKYLSYPFISFKYSFGTKLLSCVQKKYWIAYVTSAVLPKCLPLVVFLNDRKIWKSLGTRSGLYCGSSRYSRQRVSRWFCLFFAECVLEFVCKPITQYARGPGSFLRFAFNLPAYLLPIYAEANWEAHLLFAQTLR